jgi:hypothetical protein
MNAVLSVKVRPINDPFGTRQKTSAESSSFFAQKNFLCVPSQRADALYPATEGELRPVYVETPIRKWVFLRNCVVIFSMV